MWSSRSSESTINLRPRTCLAAICEWTRPTINLHIIAYSPYFISFIKNQDGSRKVSGIVDKTSQLIKKNETHAQCPAPCSEHCRSLEYRPPLGLTGGNKLYFNDRNNNENTFAYARRSSISTAHIGLYKVINELAFSLWVYSYLISFFL